MAIQGSKIYLTGALHAATSEGLLAEAVEINFLKADGDTTVLSELESLLSAITNLNSRISTIENAKNLSYVAVDTLPEASADTMNKIYLVPSQDGKENNIKDEYITIEVISDIVPTGIPEYNPETPDVEYKWEKIGSTDIDLTDYIKEEYLETVKSELDTKNTEQDTRLNTIDSKIATLEEKVQLIPDESGEIDLSSYATKEEVTSLISSIKQFEYVVVNELPEASESTLNKIYLVSKEDDSNKYEPIGLFETDVNNSTDPSKEDDNMAEYITVSSGEGTDVSYKWEKLGNLGDINLKDYATNDKVDEVADDVEDLQTSIAKLMDATFPITISLSASKVGTNHNVVISVKELGVKYVPDTMVLTLTSYKLTSEITNFETLKDDFVATSEASLSVSTPIKANREVFNFSVSSEGRTSKSTSITKYICYSGSSEKDILEVSDIDYMTMAYASGVNFNPTVSTGNNQYIYILVPNNLNINKITSSGFDVILSTTVPTLTTDLGVFKVYRTSNKLTANTWNLVIS